MRFEALLVPKSAWWECRVSVPTSDVVVYRKTRPALEGREGVMVHSARYPGCYMCLESFCDARCVEGVGDRAPLPAVGD